MLTRNCLSLLLWVLFDGGLLTPLQPQPQQTLATEPRENVIHLPGQRSHFHRVKRGWVWNQFFVLEEYIVYQGPKLFLKNLIQHLTNTSPNMAESLVLC